MKIEDPSALASSSITPASAEVTRPGSSDRVRKGADGVTLSQDLQLANDAVKASAVTVDVRQEAVTRARALIESGTLGADTGRLADAIIDSLLESHDPAP